MRIPGTKKRLSKVSKGTIYHVVWEITTCGGTSIAKFPSVRSKPSGIGLQHVSVSLSGTLSLIPRLLGHKEAEYKPIHPEDAKTSMRYKTLLPNN
eukprot:5949814-Amphidinium_carterae.1